MGIYTGINDDNHVDIVIIGAGASGMAAAISAARVFSANVYSANTNPVNTHPLSANLANADPVSACHSNTNPVNTCPANANPTNTNPVNTKPVNTKFVNTNQVSANHANTCPTNADPTNTNRANENPAKIVLLEKNSEPGKKLLVTGHGRCNLTNVACEDSENVLNFFRRMGMLLRLEKGGMYYPASGQAATVRDALRECIGRMKIDICVDQSVSEVQKTGDCFIIYTDKDIFTATKLILATGGKAGPQFGCTGDGYVIAKALGHSITSPLPALVQMVCDEEAKGRLIALKGVRVKGAASFYCRGELLETAVGEIQFGETGLSGICIFDLSRNMRLKEDRVWVKLDLAPDYSKEEIECLLKEGLPAGLTGILPQKVASLIEEEANSDPKQCAELIKGMTFNVTGTKGWKEAQVTSGGIRLSEIDMDMDTMESKHTPGFYMCGEVLDYDGKCGGFNLNWAWNTGIKAGQAAAWSILKEKTI